MNEQELKRELSERYAPNSPMQRALDAADSSDMTTPPLRKDQRMEGDKFIWTKRAIGRWAIGKSTASHTISTPNIREVYAGYIAQLKEGTPWILVDIKDRIIDISNFTSMPPNHRPLLISTNHDDSPSNPQT